MLFLSQMTFKVNRESSWIRLHGVTAAAVAATLLLLLGTTSADPLPDPDQRPNFLIIITDQQHAGMMSCAGNRYVKTPAMDSLAATGMRFERAYPTNPVCIPSRVSMVTGHYPSRFGMRSNREGRNQAPREARENALGRIFRGAGYETVYGGKTHWMRGMNPTSLGFKNLTDDQRDELAEKAASFLQSKQTQPFLLITSFINPHDICYMAIDDYTRAAGKEQMYPRSHVERERLAAALKLPAGVTRDEFFQRLCPPLPDNYEVPVLEPECVTEKYLGGWSFRRYARTEWSNERWRLHRWAYCRLTEMVDKQIGTVLDALRHAGLEEKTVVIFLSDHGDLDAAHRLEHKSVPYEEAARVPFILSQKGVTKPGVVDDEHLVSVGLDLIPTLCDYAGIDRPKNLLGQSVRPLAEGRAVSSWRDQLVVESLAGRMLRTDRFKYIVYESGAHREQLIDLANDPGEMENLAETPKYQDVLREHRQRLREWVRETNDRIAKPYVLNLPAE